MSAISTMLIVDDDVGFRETLSGVFEHRGFDVLQADDGETALDIVRNTTVNIGLFDFHMPRLTGLETIRRIRLIRPELPCVLLSAALDDSIRDEAGRIRENSAIPLHVLPKPVQLRQILSLVMDTVAASDTSPSRSVRRSSHPSRSTQSVRVHAHVHPFPPGGVRDGDIPPELS
ncbi:MAG: response regulator [Planctomycetia bacterium]|nr:response regulator [Planctomycetia bacterium]